MFISAVLLDLFQYLSLCGFQFSPGALVYGFKEIFKVLSEGGYLELCHDYFVASPVES